jgi:sec-independent protein translocase protein TatC
METNETGTRAQAEMPFLDHLEELRSRLIWSFVALLVGMVLGLFAVAELGVLEIIKIPIQDLLPNETLKYTSPTTPFFITKTLRWWVCETSHK